MNPEFWQTRWQEGRIGFNQSEVNPFLIEYFSALNLSSGSRVFVPLCGKSIDMLWLATQGFDVVGVELVETAVQQFFDEQGIVPTVYHHPEHHHPEHPHSDKPVLKYYQGQLPNQTQTITLWVADIFALTSADIGVIDAIYDKAALIALPEDMRLKYSAHIQQLALGCDDSVSANVNASANHRPAPQLLLTLNYDQSKKNGPPFSINDDQIQQYYGQHYHPTELASKPTTIGSVPELTVTEHVWLLSGYGDK